MSKKNIEKPKVFISYAWGTDEYQEKVILFATRLQTECGIEVVIDKWSMDAGNDTYAFMEKSVNDKTINFVILLLDKNYMEKADNRKGGVGTETQIISTEVYNKTEQTKFVPVVFERGEKGEVYKPTYLKGLLHFDLTKEDIENEFVRLVRHLYGVKTYPIPPIGKKPEWVDKAETISIDFYSPISRLDREENTKKRQKIVASILEDLTSKIMAINVPNTWGQPQDIKPFMDAIDETKQYKDTYIDLIEKIISEDFFEDIFADFVEKYYNIMKDNNSNSRTIAIRGLFLHEIAIYTIAILWKNAEFAKIRNLLQRTYFVSNRSGTDNAGFREVLYSYDRADCIKFAKCHLDDKEYYNASAQILIERINSKCSEGLFTFADTLIFNLDILYFEKHWYWFPITYIYGSSYHNTNTEFRRFARDFISKYKIKKYKSLFDTEDVSAIKTLFRKIEDYTKNNKRYSYPSSFESASLILDFIKIEEVGTLT